MTRNFDDWLAAYIEYASNEYAPEHFTRWVGLSVLAAALERKVWLPEQGGYCNYPNLFVILAAGPGVGKSSAIRRGIPLLRGVKEKNPKLKIVEGVTTAAGLRKGPLKFCDTYPGMSGQENTFNSVYLVGREGSDSPLKNHGDDFRSMACHMYDCEEEYEFTTATDGVFRAVRPVMNMIVGTTFDFLGSVVDQNSVFGGLASRFTYVIEKEDKLSGEFMAPVAEELDEKRELGNAETRAKLIEDLVRIHRMYGGLRIDKGALVLGSKWFETFKDEYNSNESMRMKAISIRKRTLLKKLLTLFSVSRRDSMIITEDDARDAIELVEEVTKNNPYVMSQAIMANAESQHGTTQLILQTLKKKGGRMPKKALLGVMLSRGNGIDMINKTFEALIAAGHITCDLNGIVELFVDPDRNL